MELLDQLQLFERDVFKLSGTKWISEPMKSKSGEENQYVYMLSKGLNKLSLDFSISIYQESEEHVKMFEGKMYWNGDLKSISYLSLGKDTLISIGSIIIDKNTWHSKLKWIKPNGETTEIKDSNIISEETMQASTQIKTDRGEFERISKTVWNRI
jgi:hypothetical protein